MLRQARIPAAALVFALGVNFFTPRAIATDAAPLRPFPQHTKYAVGSILPSHATQAQRDDAALSFYQKWKAKYLVPSKTAGQFYVLVDEEQGTGKGPKKISISEGHGYGMLIAAFIAGADPQARELFDGLWRFARAHPSRNNPRLMAWMQVTGEIDSPGGDDDSATDGDLDIAQALLLADAQWGNAGPVHYRDEARALIAAIKGDEINAKTWTTKLGDWTEAGDKMFFSTRLSDFMPSHFRAYQSATDDADWSRVIDAGYAMLDGVQSRFASKTGLLPDFVIALDKSPRPPAGKHLEGKHDGHFSYNACRVPLRLGLDFLLHSESRAKAALMPMNAWVKGATGGRPGRIVAGYDLGGKILDRDDRSMAFTACFGVGAMCDVAHQDWLDALWDHVVASDDPGDRYYARTLKMLCLLAMSGNWWSPAP
jgi:endo-1,4-beta-D-glucanase Y